MDENNENGVTVAVRIRPLLKNENKNIIQTIENEPQVIIVQDKRNIFAFDHVFNEQVTQLDVYDKTVKPLISKVVSGFNCTVLAYGQTGTGKTYTMGSNPQIYFEDKGLITRLLDDFFNHINSNINTKLSVSFIEIYNEKVYDLLGNNHSFLNVKGFKIQNMMCINVRDSLEAYHWLTIGSNMRHTGHTTLNNNSSRSHAVFTLYFTSADGKISKFHMVDLAGSESVRRTGNEGKAFREGITINKGLLSVGRVISALLKNDKVVPYRESMLTTILQDSLNIRNYVVLLACVSPNIDDMNETLATLRFAEKTRTLKSKPQLEMIASEFEKIHPEIFEKERVGPTPFKRKIGSISCSASTTKKKLKPFNPKSSFLPSFSLTSSPKSFKNDTLSISSSTTIEPSHFSYSPIIKRCTEVLQTTIIENLNTIVKSHIKLRTPLKEKDNLLNQSNWTPTTENKINEIIKKQVLELTSKRSTPIINVERVQLTSKRLDFNEDSPLATKLELSPKHQKKPDLSPIFKIPTLIAPIPVRRSTRLSIIKSSDLEQSSPILFLPQRRSIRLSIRRSMAPPPLIPPTPAPRTKLKSPNVIPKPAPRTTMKKPSLHFAKTKKKIKNNSEKKSRKSIRSQHYDYVLETLNSGTLKELQILATIGVKTAVQIITYRNLHGSFNDFKDVEKIPSWRGKGYERFMVSNHLEAYL